MIAALQNEGRAAGGHGFAIWVCGKLCGQAQTVADLGQPRFMRCAAHAQSLRLVKPERCLEWCNRQGLVAEHHRVCMATLLHALARQVRELGQQKCVGFLCKDGVGWQGASWFCRITAANFLKRKIIVKIKLYIENIHFDN